MYIDDFFARQTMHTDDPSPLDGVARQPGRSLLRALWNIVRQFAWGIDAYSFMRHGMDLPPDHGARRRPTTWTGDPRL